VDESKPLVPDDGRGGSGGRGSGGKRGGGGGRSGQVGHMAAAGKTAQAPAGPARPLLCTFPSSTHVPQFILYLSYQVTT